MAATRRRRGQAGVTLIEILVAITLLSALTVAMMFAMRIGLGTFSKTSDKLMADRRVAGAQRILLEQIEGMIPVKAPCTGSPVPSPQAFPFFQGDAGSMRLVSAYSLQQAWRGRPQILEFAVIPGAEGKGVRLIVNEIPYAGAAQAGRSCVGMAPNPGTNAIAPVFTPVAALPQSFVLADQLEFCRIFYLMPGLQANMPPLWTPVWAFNGWPLGIRVEMAPMQADRTRLEPVTVTAAVHLRRAPDIPYVDF